jgi:hypothetical protein
MSHSISQEHPAQSSHLPSAWQSLPQPAINRANALRPVGSIVGPTAITALAGACFSIVNPLSGAVFGAVYAVTAVITNGICDYTGCVANNELLKVAQCGLSMILSTVAAWAVCNAIGIPITFAAAALLTVAIAAVGLGVALVAGSTCLCCCLVFCDWRPGEDVCADWARAITYSTCEVAASMGMGTIDPHRIAETSSVVIQHYFANEPTNQIAH